MSTQYNIEPLPTGRVLIKTSMGPLDVELFAKETPQTCRSFIQLCLEGYYNNAIFHRVIKEFIIQTGDPTGTGTGGEAATPEGVVKDEFHSRLRYTRRGLVGMANSGAKDDNGSQFFITLAPTPELDKKNTLFGRIGVGDTVFNALRIGELETDKLDRPIHPPRVISTEVVENPFKDIVPRSTEAERQERQRKLAEAKTKAVVKKAKKQSKALLSFGDDEADAGTETVKTKVKSIYDLDGPPQPSKKRQELDSGPSKPSKQAPQPKQVGPKEPACDPTDRTTSSNISSFAAPVPIIVDSSSHSPPPAQPRPKSAPVKESIEDQIAALKSQLKGLKNKRPVEEEREEEEESSKRGKRLLEAEIIKYMAGGRAILGKRSRKTRREDETLSRLTVFQRKLLGAPVEESAQASEYLGVEECTLHNVTGCMSCFDRFGEQRDEEDPKSIWGHKLVFAKDAFGKDEKYRLERQGEDLEVIDPREREKEFAKQERRNRMEHRSTKVWHQDGGKGNRVK